MLLYYQGLPRLHSGYLDVLPAQALQPYPALGPEPVGPLNRTLLCSQRLQYPLIEEDTLDYGRIPNMI